MDKLIDTSVRKTRLHGRSYTLKEKHMKENTECNCNLSVKGIINCEKHGFQKTDRQGFLCKNSKKCFEIFEDVAKSEDKKVTFPQLEILTDEWGELSGEDVTKEIEAIRRAQTRKQRVTGCSCDYSLQYDFEKGQGWCNRHSCWKTDEQKRLCQNNLESFNQWEEGEGEGQESLTKEQKNLLKQEIEEEQPTLLRKAWNFAKALKRHVADGAKSVSEEEYKERLSQCDPCIYRDGNHCLHASCGCNLTHKAKWRSEDCPIGRWPKNDEPTD